MLKIGTRVSHFDGGPNTHGLGTIVGYNGVSPNKYAEDKPEEALELAIPFGLVGTLIESMFYSGERCPYVVQWDNGYKDVYEKESVQEVK